MNIKNISETMPKYENIPPYKFAKNRIVTDTVSFSGKNALNSLHVFCHHIYEYKKGLRNLVLTTEKAENKDVIEKRIKKEKIPYLIHEIEGNKINVFFGDQACIDVISTFNKRLNKIDPEQDFILGIMLGYDKLKQVKRYLKIKTKGKSLDELTG